MSQSQSSSLINSDSTHISKGKSTAGAGSRTSEMDEGICDGDGDQLTSDIDSDQQGCGPLRSSLLASGDHSGIHSVISETIHKQNLESSFEKDIVGGGLKDSTSVQNASASPQQSAVENSKDAVSEKESTPEAWDLEDTDEQSKDNEYRKYFTAQLSLNAETSERSK